MNKLKIVYVITKKGNKSFWLRIGVGFVNQDGSINIKLDALPVSGEMQIRDYVPGERLSGTAGETVKKLDTDADDETLPFT